MLICSMHNYINALYTTFHDWTVSHVACWQKTSFEFGFGVVH